MQPKTIRYIGFLSMLVGALSLTITLFFPLYFKFAIPLTFIGFLSATLYTFLKTRNEYDELPFWYSFVGMGLSSGPIVLLMLKSFFK